MIPITMQLHSSSAPFFGLFSMTSYLWARGCCDPMGDRSQHPLAHTSSAKNYELHPRLHFDKCVKRWSKTIKILHLGTAFEGGVADVEIRWSKGGREKLSDVFHNDLTTCYMWAAVASRVYIRTLIPSVIDHQVPELNFASAS